MSNILNKIGRASMSAVLAVTLAVPVCAGTAQTAFAVDAMEAGTGVSCSPTPFSAAVPEYLGLNTTDERWGMGAVDAMQYDKITNNSGALRYLLMGTTEYNTNPNPYMYNSVYNTTGQKVVPDSKREVYTTTNANRALGFYGQKTGDDNIWNMKPDIIMGVLTTDASTSTDYTAEAADLATKDASKFSNYHPVAVNATMDIVPLLYDLAAKADKIVADDPTRTLRYGSATALAQNYEKATKGSQGYVLSQLAKNNKQKKTIAYITGNDGTNVTLSAGFSGNVVALENVAINYADGKAGDDGTMTLTIEQLKTAAPSIDLFVVQSGDDDRSPISLTGLESLFGKMYWVADQDCGNVGSDNRGPGLIVNYGRMLGCLYPEYIDQSDWVAYVFDTVFHVKANMLQTAINRAMDGIRNWDVKSGNGNDYLQWTQETAADYNKADVASKIEYGSAYIQANSANLPESLRLTDKVGTISAFNTLTEPTVKPNDKTPAQPEQPTQPDQPTTPSTSDNQTMYRLYNTSSMEHLYTKDLNEVNVLTTMPNTNWKNEGQAWVSPATSKTPVYRLHNTKSGEHHYTKDENEVKTLCSMKGLGWKSEGIKWYSDDAQGVPVYRVFNAAAGVGAHHFTKDSNERKVLTTQRGWADEGVAWYGL